MFRFFGFFTIYVINVFINVLNFWNFNISNKRREERSERREIWLSINTDNIIRSEINAKTKLFLRYFANSLYRFSGPKH